MVEMARPIPEVEQDCICSKCRAQTMAFPDADGKWDCKECGWRHYPCNGDYGVAVVVIPEEKDEKGLGKRQKEVLALLKEKPMYVDTVVLKLGYRKRIFHQLLWRGLIEKDLVDDEWTGKWRAT